MPNEGCMIEVAVMDPCTEGARFDHAYLSEVVVERSDR